MSSEKTRKLTWVSNGYLERKLPIGKELPEGFSPGKLPRSKEHCKKLSEAKKGKKDSEETKQKKSRSKKGRHWKLIEGRRVWFS